MTLAHIDEKPYLSLNLKLSILQRPISVHLQGNTLTIVRPSGSYDEKPHDVSYIESISVRSQKTSADEGSVRQYVEVLTRNTPRMLPRVINLCTSWEGTRKVVDELAKRVGVLRHYHRTLDVLRPGENRAIYAKLRPPTFTVDREYRYDDIGKGFQLTGPRSELVSWDTPLQSLIERDLFDPWRRVFNGPVRIGSIYADTLEVTVLAPDLYAQKMVGLQSVHRLDMPVISYRLNLTNVHNDLSDFDEIWTALLGPQVDTIEINSTDNGYGLTAKFQCDSLNFQLSGHRPAGSSRKSTSMELKIENTRAYSNAYRLPEGHYTPAILNRYSQFCKLAGDIRYTPTLYKTPDHVEGLANKLFTWVDRPRATFGFTQGDRTHLFQLDDIANLEINGSTPAKGSGYLSLSVVKHSGRSIAVLHGPYREIYKSLENYQNELDIETVHGNLYPDC